MAEDLSNLIGLTSCRRLYGSNKGKCHVDGIKEFPGKKVGEGVVPNTVPLKLSLSEGVDVGMDTGSAVDFTYQLPFAFTSKIEKVAVELVLPLETEALQRTQGGLGWADEPSKLLRQELLRGASPFCVRHRLPFFWM